MIEDPLDIPPSLRRQANARSTPAPRQPLERKWIMPPAALGAVAPAVRAGCDTMQKIRKRTQGRYSDSEIRKVLDALLRSGDVARHGRRYISSRRPTRP